MISLPNMECDFNSLCKQSSLNAKPMNITWKTRRYHVEKNTYKKHATKTKI
jgi:hypothetical protein